MRQPRHLSRSRGFTLIELLVVIAIIAILVALLLPAVQQVREAARKSQCQDHLHNLAIALASYEGSHRFYPVGRQSCDGACDTGAAQVYNKNGKSGFIGLLPYIEQKALFDLFSNTDPVYPLTANTTWLASNLAAVTARPDVYVCPSNVDQPSVTVTVGAVTAEVATGSYAFVSGTNGPSQTTNLNTKTDNTGMFVYRNGFKVTDNLDGTSNTIYVGEVVGAHTSLSPNKWIVGSRHQDTLRTTENPVNTRPGLGIVFNTNNGAFASEHPGGAQFAFGDGRCVLIGENTDLTVYRGLSTRRGGEAVSYR